MLSVAGQMTIFLSRTRGTFRSIGLGQVLWMAVSGTWIVAELIALYGFVMSSLGRGWIVAVWRYGMI